MEEVDVAVGQQISSLVSSKIEQEQEAFTSQSS
jgi:hypothetical protein